MHPRLLATFLATLCALLGLAGCCPAVCGSETGPASQRSTNGKKSKKKSKRGSAKKSKKPGKAKGFRARLDKRIDALVAHPRIEVVTAHYAPGLSKAQIKRIEKKHGAPLPRDLKRFYREVGRVQLLWRCLPKGERHTKRPDPDVPYAKDWPPDGGFHGLVDIYTPEEIFFTGDYEDDLWFPGEPELNDTELDGRKIHRKHLRRFDNQDHYSQVALLVEPGAKDIPVVFGGDYFAEVVPQSARIARYLDMVVDTVGYQGDGDTGLCRGLEKKLKLKNPYRRDRPLYLDYVD